MHFTKHIQEYAAKLKHQYFVWSNFLALK
jgi:hypothetical protein